jgi:hypothetical protein
MAYKEVAQTFVVQNDGILTGIDVVGSAQAPQYAGFLSVFIVPLSNGLPVTDLGLALGSTSIFVDQYPDRAVLNLSGLSVPVSHGDMLAFVLVADLKPGGTTAFNVDFTGFNYEAGVPFDRVSTAILSLTGWIVSVDGFDVAFRTYVDCSDALRCAAAIDPPPPPPPAPGPVPEPQTLVLVLAGVLTMLAYSAGRPIA